MIERIRRLHDEPPTPEEMLAWSRGELSVEEAAEVRARLDEYPELARAYDAPYDQTDVQPGDPDYVSDEELDRRWAAFRKTTEPQWGRVVPFPRVLAAAAAAAVIMIGAIVWQALKIRDLETRLATPRTLAEYLMHPDAARGENTRGLPERSPVVPVGQDTKLALNYRGDDAFDGYRAEILDLNVKPPRRLWNQRDITRNEDNEFEIVLLREFLRRPGRYQVVVYGLDRRTETRLATYTIRAVK